MSRKKYRYDRDRGNSAARGYGHQHRKERREYLRRNPVCATPKCGARATHYDEIIPGLGHVRNNVQGLCHSCHSRKTALHDGGFGRGSSLIGFFSAQPIVRRFTKWLGSLGKK